MESLEIEKISMLTVSTLEDILNSLFAISLETNKANLKFKYNSEYTSFQCDPKTLIYILVEIVEYLLSNNIKEINIDCEKLENKTVLKICNENFATSVLEKIKKIAALEEDINKENNANNIIIVTKNTTNSAYNPQ